MKRLGFAGFLFSLTITSAQATDIQGFWKYDNHDGRVVGDWAIGVSNGRIHGSAYWWLDGKPYAGNIDKLEGTISGNTVSITRYLSGENQGSTQNYKGTITSDGKVSGSWTGAGDGSCGGACGWSATITPLASSTPTCPVVTCPTVPTCPTIPSCPTVTTDKSTFNFNTGRLIIPNLGVSMTPPFGGTPQVFNYDIEMQQRSGAFVFDLDLSKVVQR
ncbi:MAG: hypothetical protein RIT27_867 [Pseudomonadota bacterium]|jgi:hypothetical protein